VCEVTRPVPWTKPRELSYVPGEPLPPVGSRHPGGFNALFADGSVRFLKMSHLTGRILHALITRNGGEDIPDDL